MWGLAEGLKLRPGLGDDGSGGGGGFTGAPEGVKQPGEQRRSWSPRNLHCLCIESPSCGVAQRRDTYKQQTKKGWGRDRLTRLAEGSGGWRGEGASGQRGGGCLCIESPS
jgi:hypothetical protein